MIRATAMNLSWCGRPLAACAVSIAVAIVTLAASVSAADFAASDALMLRFMSTHNVPGAALALIKDGSIVLEKGYGFRDLAAHAPITTTTLFNIGSISKSFTALGVAQLVDQHQVDLDDQSSDTSLICGSVIGKPRR
jgi:CubicO group peptidase (beta-lactamase class C family)